MLPTGMSLTAADYSWLAGVGQSVTMSVSHSVDVSLPLTSHFTWPQGHAPYS